MAVSSFQIYPEYESFTGVEIKLSVDGDDAQTFVISKIGEHLQSLTVKEGTLGNGTQFTAPSSGGIASGTVTLTDENNAIFLSLMASKAQGGQQLLNRLDITLKTYSGIKRYENCRINKWNCNFNGGCPTITLEWQSIGGSNAPSYADPQKSSINPNEAKKLLIDEGINDKFGTFKKAVNQIFNNTLKFQYTTKKVIDTDSLKDISDDGDLKFFNGENLVPGKIIIPKSYLLETNDKKYRFKLQPDSESTSLLTSIMKEFCSIAQVQVSGTTNSEENLNVEWKFLFGDTILIYTYKNMGELSIPEDSITKSALENSVFLYNSSFMQGGMYKTNAGLKRAFIIDSISTSFDFSQILTSNLSDHNNSVCPNGNIVITSRGAMTIPQEVPAEVEKRIKAIESLNLSQNFSVRITVYNFVHFYVMGNTLVDLVVFDHLGNIHPLTGKLRIIGYQYDISAGGVLKADVTLAPPLSITNPNFEGVETSSPSYPKDSISEDTSIVDSSNQGKADIGIDSSTDYNPNTKKEDPPNYLGIQVKKIDGAVFHQSKEPFRKNSPNWVVVHYTASPGAGAKKETEYFANTSRVVSTHFFCDSENVYQVVDEKHASWHCGSGFTQQPDQGKTLSEKVINKRTIQGGNLSFDTKNGVKDWRYDISSTNHLNWSSSGSDIGDFNRGNLDSFGVDLCCKKGSKGSSVKDTDWYCTDETIENCAKTVAYLCHKYSIDVSHVIRHADCTGKPCLPLYNTEVYTNCGFRPMCEIKKNDLVYQYKLDTHTIELTKVLSVVSPYVATVCKNRAYEATLNHRTLYKDFEGFVKTEPFENILCKEVYLFAVDSNNEIKPNYLLFKECSFYNTVVSCIEVESGYIIIRQNGVIFITGNCPRPFVSLPGDKDNQANDMRWKLLKKKNSEGEYIDGQIAIPGIDTSTAYSYSKKDDIYLEDDIADPKKRKSFLGKVAGYMKILKEQNYPVAKTKK